MANNRRRIFLAICLIVFTLSFFSNFWEVAPSKEKFDEYDLFSEAMVLGRMAKSEKEGLFSYAGFPRVNYNKKSPSDDPFLYTDSTKLRDSIIIATKAFQIEYYVGKRDLPDQYCPYLSHGGGQALFYSIAGKILPVDNATNYSIFRFINALLVAFCFTLFLGWAYRNFGVIAAFVTFLLILFSPFLVSFCGRNGLWWSLWSFYVPFLVMLLALERRNLHPEKMKDNKIVGLLFVFVFIKCFFTGFEFISTSLLAIYAPVIYYSYLEKKKIIPTIIFSIKLGIATILSVCLYSFILLVQLKYLMGDFTSGLEYFISSFQRRAVYIYETRVNIFKTYFQGNAFDLGFVSIKDFYYYYLMLIILFFSLVTYFFSKKVELRKYRALILTTIFSISCPLSWLILFKEHAFGHPHLDFIIWYIPFLLYGFLVIGVGISQLMTQVKLMQNKRQSNL